MLLSSSSSRSSQRQHRSSWSLVVSCRAMMAAAVMLMSAATLVHGQSESFCTGKLGEPDWACDALTPVPADLFEEFLSLPGSPDPDNPTQYKQIAGKPAFDEATGLRNDNSAVFVLTEGSYLCMLAESDGEAVLFGDFVSSATPYPTSSWLPESVDALLAKGTKLRYIVYTHAHWDHMGAAGLVADYFAEDEPDVISGRRTRKILKSKDKRDPDTAFGNNRGVPLPGSSKKDVLKVGGLRFSLEKVHAHKTGDYLIHPDKNNDKNADAGIATSVVMVADAVFPGWAPFFAMGHAEDVQDYLEGIDQINDVDFDVLVGGHLTRLGTKEDVQTLVEFLADVLAGAELGVATVSGPDVVIGTGFMDPANPNAGNSWLVTSEIFDRTVDVCYDYVLDSSARGQNWLVQLAGVEVMLRANCWAMQSFVRYG